MEIKERMSFNEDLFRDKVVCVFGGLGSIGSDIVKGLLNFDVKKVIIVDNRETAVFYAKAYPLSDKVYTESADIRDYDVIEKILRNVDIVFHAAAMKHVVVCEDAPFEAIKTNVIGTRNIIEASIKNEVERMILISTDKAVNPVSVMGATKLLAEKLISAVAISRKDNKTKFGIVRFGNVLYSRGSVLEIWNKQLKEGGKISITDGNMTRFFMNLSQCVQLIFKATELAQEGEIFILKMPAIRMGDLAQAFLELKNVSPSNITSIGVRKGEKMHEELLLGKDNSKTFENDSLFIKLPTYASEGRVFEMIEKGFKESTSDTFISNTEGRFLNLEEIKVALSKEKELLRG